jgi:hypothetical protein
MDIAAELIRDEITQDAEILREFDDFDPYIGNQLESIIRYDSSLTQSAFLAFPMGELSRDLSWLLSYLIVFAVNCCPTDISPLVFSSDGGASLKPSAQAIHTFDTPIRQISTSKSQGSSHTLGS